MKKTAMIAGAAVISMALAGCNGNESGTCAAKKRMQCAAKGLQRATSDVRCAAKCAAAKIKCAAKCGAKDMKCAAKKINPCAAAKPCAPKPMNPCAPQPQ